MVYKYVVYVVINICMTIILHVIIQFAYKFKSHTYNFKSLNAKIVYFTTSRFISENI